MSRFSTRLAGLGLAGAVVLLLTAAPNAGAGTYTVDTCANGSVSGWSHFNLGEWSSWGNGCGMAGNGLAAAIWVPAGSSAGWRFTAPADTEIAGFRLTRSFSLPPNRPYGTGVATLLTDGAGRGYFDQTANYADAPLAAGPAVRSASGLTGQRTLTAVVDCGGGLSCTGSGQIAVYDASVDLRDDFGPSIGAVSGSLLTPASLKGARALSYSASDRGGGVRRALLSVDGAPLAERALDCSSALAVPCPLSVSGTFQVDTTRLPDGDHDVELGVYDATLANRTAYGPVRITVDNVPAPAATQAPRIYGTAAPGVTLYADDGTWAGAGLTLARRWQRHQDGGWEDIDGATQPGYTVAPADAGQRLRFVVRATNGEGSTEAFSAATGAVSALAPAATPAPTPTPPATGTPTPPAAAAPIPAPAVVLAAPPLVAEPAPAGIPSAAFASTGRSSITLRWGETRKITGALMREDGRPLAGARVTITSRVLILGAEPVQLGHVTTDRGGRFVYLPAPGVSRALSFGFGGRSATVTIRVTARVTLSLAKDGRIRGHVSGAPPNSRKIVDLQRPSGHAWRTFAATRLRRGTFSARAPRGLQRVRALVRTDTGWPLDTSTSAAARR